MALIWMCGFDLLPFANNTGQTLDANVASGLGITGPILTYPSTYNSVPGYWTNGNYAQSQGNIQTQIYFTTNSSATLLWIGFRSNFNYVSGGNTQSQYIEFVTDPGYTQFAGGVLFNGNGTDAIWYVDSGDNIYGPYYGATDPGNWHYYEIKFDFTHGVITFYRDGVVVSYKTLLPLYGGTNWFMAIKSLGGLNYDDMYIADDTGPPPWNGQLSPPIGANVLHITGRRPIAPGAAATWTPTLSSLANWQNAGNVQLTSASFVHTATVNNIDSYELTQITGILTSNIVAEQLYVVANGTGSVHAESLLLSGGTYYTSGSTALGSSLTVFPYTPPAVVDPNTGDAWTQGSLNATQAGVKLVSSSGASAQAYFVGQEVLVALTQFITENSLDLLSPLPVQHFVDNNGNPLVGGLLFTYAAGTTTKLATYIDATGNTANTNPITLNSRGEANVWLPPGTAYKFTLSPAGDTDPPSNPIWTVDNITVGLASLPYGTDTGSANAYVANAVAGIAAFAPGLAVIISIANTNTGASTLNINSTGAKTIVDELGNALVAGALRSGSPALFISSSTQWILVGGNASSGQQSIPYAVDGGSTNAISVTNVSAISAVQTGTSIFVKVANTSTSHCTLSVNGSSATAITDQAGNQLQASAFISGEVALMVYDGTNWRYNYTPSTVISTSIVNAITGLLPTSMSGNTLTVTSGQASDSTNSVYINLSMNTSWAASNGNAINGYQGGTSLPTSSTVHFFVCTGGSGTGTFASNSLSPTLPSGYSTSYRRIFSIPTDGSGNLRTGTAVEVEGGAILYYLSSPQLDVSITTATSANRTLYGLSVPAGIKVEALARMQAFGFTLYTAPDEPDNAVSYAGGAYAGEFGAAPGYDNASALVGGATPFATGYAVVTSSTVPLTTNTSGQIGIRYVTAFGWCTVATRGWRDFRRS